MNTSNSGIISTEFVNVSDSFSDYTDISQSNHNRIVKAKRFGKWYVLKGLNAKYTDMIIFTELLHKEFDLGITLDHPNIISTVGKESDSQIGDCIILEYIDGVTLKEWLKTTPPKRERRRVVMQLLHAMSYFHAKGVIHRDLKPDNILITRNGANVKVIDFGLSDSDQYAILKQPVGSRKYSAPEQSDRGFAIDQRVDIYAFGCILTEFELGGIFSRIAKKATRKDPQERYANTEQIISTISRQRTTLSVAATVAAVLVVGVAVFALIENRPEPIIMATPSVPDTVVREVLRDTIYVTKEVKVPVTVEQIVLKDIGESDSVYIARKAWEKSLKKRIEAKNKELFAPLVEQYHKAKSYDETINKLNKVLINTYEEISKFNTKIINEVGPDNDFYYEICNIVIIASFPYTSKINDITEKLRQKAYPSKEKP